MKRLANLRNSPSESPHTSWKKVHTPALHKSKKSTTIKNNPYPASGFVQPAPAVSDSRPLSEATRASEASGRYESVDGSADVDQRALTLSNKSAAPTLATNPETLHSDAGQSKAGTSNTLGGSQSLQDGGGNSTFSSPNHSEQSLTTTLTTIQSMAPTPGVVVNGGGHVPPSNTQSLQTPVHFSHQYPVSPPPASAIPPHMTSQSTPTTYQAATANNMLTDNASILTLASSSKRRRRHSLDTNASVRALAPSSLWGGSRDSLPLSVLSGNPDTPGANASGALYQGQGRPSVGGLASAERVSVYSSSGVMAPALSSERNSYYAGKQAIDNASVRSGFLGHGRTESINGSIGGVVIATSPLTSPRETNAVGRLSRRGSDWKEGPEASDGEDEEHNDRAKEEASAGQKLSRCDGTNGIPRGSN